MTAPASPSTARPIIRQSSGQDLPAILDLMRVSLGESATLRRSEDLWRWKHEANPFGKSHVLVAQEEGGRVVGLRAFLKWEFMQDGQTVKAVRAVDTATHPDFRRIGLFSELTRQAVNDVQSAGIEMVFNTPNGKSRPGYLKLGWKDVGLIEPSVLVVNYPGFVAGLANWFVLRRRPGDLSANEGLDSSGLHTVSELLSHSGADALLRRDSALWGPRLHTQRSRAYLRWRYGAHPDVSYSAEMIVRGSTVEAAAIVRARSRFGMREMVVAELLLSRPDPGLARELFVNLRRKIEADYMVCYFPRGSAHRRAVDECGFRRAPRQGMRLTARPLAADLSKIASVEEWGLALGDIELF